MGKCSVEVQLKRNTARFDRTMVRRRMTEFSNANKSEVIVYPLFLYNQGNI